MLISVLMMAMIAVKALVVPKPRFVGPNSFPPACQF